MINCKYVVSILDKSCFKKEILCFFPSFVNSKIEWRDHIHVSCKLCCITMIMLCVSNIICRIYMNNVVGATFGFTHPGYRPRNVRPAIKSLSSFRPRYPDGRAPQLPSSLCLFPCFTVGEINFRGNISAYLSIHLLEEDQLGKNCNPDVTKTWNCSNNMALLCRNTPAPEPLSFVVQRLRTTGFAPVLPVSHLNVRAHSAEFLLYIDWFLRT